MGALRSDLSTPRPGPASSGSHCPTGHGTRRRSRTAVASAPVRTRRRGPSTPRTPSGSRRADRQPAKPSELGQRHVIAELHPQLLGVEGEGLVLVVATEMRGREPSRPGEHGHVERIAVARVDTGLSRAANAGKRGRSPFGHQYSDPTKSVGRRADGNAKPNVRLRHPSSDAPVTAAACARGREWTASAANALGRARNGPALPDLARARDPRRSRRRPRRPTPARERPTPIGGAAAAASRSQARRADTG